MEPEWLRILAGDSVEGVRTSVAEREDLNEELCKMLAQDPSDQVRSVIAVKDNLPWGVLVSLQTKGVFTRAVVQRIVEEIDEEKLLRKTSKQEIKEMILANNREVRALGIRLAGKMKNSPGL